jgi:hypothetical protein
LVEVRSRTAELFGVAVPIPTCPFTQKAIPERNKRIYIFIIKIL